MDTSPHNLTTLFDQLGLSSGKEEVERFIETHSPVAADVHLVDAGFWNIAQRTFLREALEMDSDWAEVADQLNAMLRA